MGDDSCVHLRFDEFELDEANATLSRAGSPVELPPKAFGVLCALSRTPGRLVSKEALLDAVWGHRHVSESVLKSTISQLRAALGDDPKQPLYIETVSRRGYRFVALGPPTGASRPPPPAPAAPPDSDPRELPEIIGRADVLARLRAAWQAAQAGRRQVVWLAGEAGIGKTTAIERFIAELGPAQVAHGQCVEQHGAGEPYLPVLDAIASLTSEDAAVAALLRNVAPTWLLQLPWLATEGERMALGRELAGSSQLRMLRELGELLDRYTEKRPLVLVTEDLHWSDHATVQLIDHVARRRSPCRLLWLGTFRPAEVIAGSHPLQSLRQELRLHRLAEELALEPFSEKEVADYVDRHLPGRELPDSFMRALHARTDGLPMFVANLIDELSEQTTAASLQEFRVPDSLAGVIEKQIARLGREDRELLEAASVCGTEFRANSVAEALAREPHWVVQRCDALVRGQHWLNHVAIGALDDGSLDARYAFRHALYRHVLYQRIGAATRAQLHRCVAVSMTSARQAGLPVAAAEVALHFERSHDIAAALRHYAEAAESALRHFAPVEAMSLTAHALALLPTLPDGEQRDTIEIDLLGSRAVAASQLLGTVAPASTAVFERIEALSARLPGKSRRTLEMELGWVYQRHGEYDRACAHAARKAAIAQERGDRLLFLSACNLMGATQFFQGRLDEAAHWLRQGLAALEEMSGEVGEVAFVMDPGASLHARLARVLAHQGLAAEASSHSKAALARADAVGQPYGRMYALIQATLVEIRFGRPADALALGEALAAMVADHAVIEGNAFACWLRGCALVRLGEPEVGLAMITRGHVELLQPGLVGAGCCAVIGHEAEALLLLQRPVEARARLGEALGIARRIGERACLPDLLMLQAQLVNDDGARASLEEALLEARGQRAGWLELAVLVARGERGDASQGDLQALRAARERLRSGFETPLALRAKALLDAGA